MVSAAAAAAAVVAYSNDGRTGQMPGRVVVAGAQTDWSAVVEEGRSHIHCIRCSPFGPQYHMHQRCPSALSTTLEWLHQYTPCNRFRPQ